METKRKLKIEIKIAIAFVVLIILGALAYKLYVPSTASDDAKILATYGSVKYTQADLDKEYQLFTAAYALNLLDQNVSKDLFLNRTIINNMVYAEIPTADVNETALSEYAISAKSNFLKQNNIDEIAYQENYKTLGFNENDIDSFLKKEALVSSYIESYLSQIQVDPNEVETLYNTNLNLFTYNDSLYVFKVMVFSNKTIADQALEVVNNYEQYFNFSKNVTKNQKIDAKNYLFTQVLMQNSEDSSKDYNRGIYAYTDASGQPDQVNFMINSVKNLNTYEVSKILTFEVELQNEDGANSKQDYYFIFERLPNVLSLVDVGDQIYNSILQEKRSESLDIYTRNIMEQNNLTFY